MTDLIFDENVPKADWDELAGREGVKAHFLGSWAWGEVQAKRGWTPFHVGVRRNGKLVLSALLLRKMLYLGYCYYYIPRGFTADYSDYGLIEFATKSIAEYGRRHKAIHFKIDPDIKLRTIDINGSPVPGEENSALVEFLEKCGYKHRPLTYFFETEQPRFTFRIPLEGSIEEIEERYSKSTKTRIKTAEAYDAWVERGGSEDIPEFVRLMEMTQIRQDFFSHEPEFYQYFYDILKAEDMVTLYLGKIDPGKIRAAASARVAELTAALEAIEGDQSKKAAGRRKELEKNLESAKKQYDSVKDAPCGAAAVSAYLITNYGGMAWALYAANDMDYGKFFVNYEVYKQQIRDAKAKGIKVFDVFGTIGRPDSDSRLAGLFEFKKKWGGEYTEFVGEFTYVLNAPVNLAFNTLIPLYRKLRNRSLRKK